MCVGLLTHDSPITLDYVVSWGGQGAVNSHLLNPWRSLGGPNHKRIEFYSSLPRAARASGPRVGCITNSMAARLRALLAKPGIIQMPCCYDALSARLVAASGFPLTFVSGFSVAAAHGKPDTGLLSYGEMRYAMQNICEALRESEHDIPVIGDGDTGYGNAVNAKRTVRGYAAAGLAGIMIEDQVAPKRCGHTRDKAVVDRATAIERVRAAVDASREVAQATDGAAPIVIVARTDARATHGLAEAIERAHVKLRRPFSALVTSPPPRLLACPPDP